uniref:Uncharacterized protein n=1 Tax=uncultured marine crenarchaeote HF4000_APKG3H9 TaxID=455586 RepID=B3T7L7_9ARCH|nr:hypothetical protein ALOHA_HF4000APKG3H9ctg1g2 [uncultured marine crenarchaeote HF4000_APKG3H9]
MELLQWHVFGCSLELLAIIEKDNFLKQVLVWFVLKKDHYCFSCGRLSFENKKSRLLQIIGSFVVITCILVFA